MPLRVQFTKRPDGTVIVRCTRPDDSVTWQRHEKQAAFFSHHDLTHLAVESVLRLENGFYGLIASGWDITEMDGKSSRGKIPTPSALAEHIVALLSQERAGATGPLTAAEFNSQLEQVTCRPMANPIGESQLEEMRNRISELFRQWAATPPGSTLDLTFEAA